MKRITFYSRAKFYGFDKVPKHLVECDLCLDDYSSKLIKNHKRFCPKNSSEKHIKIKSYEGFRCSICNTVFEGVKSDKQFYLHLGTHEDSDIMDARNNYKVSSNDINDSFIACFEVAFGLSVTRYLDIFELCC